MQFEIDTEIFLECYRPLLEPNDYDIEFIFGSRDSGKSEFVGQKVLFDSLGDKNFRCIMIKKTAESIKDAQWETLKQLAEQYGVEDHFAFRKSPLEIEVDNGAMFIARGCDDPRKLKSIRNPTCAWIEEGDQLTLDDFTLIITTLRSKYGNIKIYFVFNPELPKGITDKKNFWLYKHWFAHTNEKNFTNIKSYPTGKGTTVDLKYRATHTTYRDNPYVSETRIAFLEDLKFSNPAKYGPYALGEWGNYSNEMPAFHSYSDTKHECFDKYTVTQTDYFDIGFDFNMAPCVAVLGQVNRSTLKHNVFKVVMGDPNTRTGLSPLEAVCAQIREEYIDTGKVIRARIRVTGDASGKSGSADRAKAKTFYYTIMKHLGIQEHQFFVRKDNMDHIPSLSMINTALHKLPEGYFNLIDVPELIADIKKSYPDAKRSLNEAKSKFGLHVLDAWRYLCDLWFGHINMKWTDSPEEIEHNIISICRRIESLNKAA